MSHSISLKLQDDIFDETETIRGMLHLARNTYINEAVAFFNKVKKMERLKRQIQSESRLVQKNSLSVLREMEDLEDPILGEN